MFRKRIIAPFEADLFEVNVDLQGTFSDFQFDLELKINFRKENMKAFGLNKN